MGGKSSGSARLECCGLTGGLSGRGKNTDPPVQLYDMVEDESEKRNVYAEHPEVVERLTKLLEKYKIQGRSRPLGKRV